MSNISNVSQLAPDQLRTFVVAADTGSFTKAGPLVHRTQSAVSMQMKKLEADLERSLFRRKGRGVGLTHDGEVLYRYAKRLLALHDEALTAVVGTKLSGTVRFGSPEDYAAQFLPRTLKRFAAVHPMVEVEVYCDATPKLRERFANGALDVILTTELDINGPDRRALELTWIIAENGGPLGETPLPIALFHSGCPYRKNALLALEQNEIAYRIAYTSPSVAGVLAAVQAGLAVAPVTRACHTPGCRAATPKDGLPSITPAAIGLHIAPNNSDEAVASFHAFMGNELDIPASAS